MIFSQNYGWCILFIDVVCVDVLKLDQPSYLGWLDCRLVIFSVGFTKWPLFKVGPALIWLTQQSNVQLAGPFARMGEFFGVCCYLDCLTSGALEAQCKLARKGDPTMVDQPPFR